MERINSVASQADGEIAGLFDDISILLSNLNIITDDLTQTSEFLRTPEGLVPKLLGEGGSVQTFFNDQNRLFDQIDSILASLNKTAEQIQAISQGLNSEVPKIASLIVETRNAVKATQDVMEGLKNNPLLREGISKKPVQETRLESLRSQEF
jgi:phospholipid/cholesterol/gamma-HCH transport system substrate-binding protein